MKKAAEDLLPHDIIYRTKMGFPTPLRQWFRDKENDSIISLLLRRKSFLSEYVNLNYVEELVAKQRGGVEDATDRLWRLLNLQVWGEMMFAGRQEKYWDGLLATAPARVTA
jgi:asparagine synthase (glutamine-hydrolysing)